MRKAVVESLHLVFGGFRGLQTRILIHLTRCLLVKSLKTFGHILNWPLFALENSIQWETFYGCTQHHHLCAFKFSAWSNNYAIDPNTLCVTVLLVSLSPPYLYNPDIQTLTVLVYHPPATAVWAAWDSQSYCSSTPTTVIMLFSTETSIPVGFCFTPDGDWSAHSVSLVFANFAIDCSLK